MNRSVHLIIFSALIASACIAGAQESASPALSSTATLSPTPANERHPVTVEVDGYRFSFEAPSAEQAAGLKQWQRLNNLAFWGFSGLTLAGMIALGSAFYREKQRQKNRARLSSKNPQEAAAGIKGLSGRPREAYPLVHLWIQEYRKHKKILDSDASFTQTELEVMKSIQEALAPMTDRKTFRIQWRPLSPTWLRSITFPHIRIVKGARLEDKTVTVDIGPIQLKGAYMVNGRFQKIGLKQADLTAADLRESNFKRARMENVRLDNACLVDADFSKAVIKKVSLSGACLRGVHFNKGSLEEVDFSDACLEGADFHEAKLIGAVFAGSNLAGAKFLDANLEWSIIEEEEYINYIERQMAKLNKEQQEQSQQWSAVHLDAPWLQKDWKFWWEYPESLHEIKRPIEIQTVRQYVESLHRKTNAIST
ncbi:MAG: pentapeptide repeat-containing protein [Candidatus Omnitrophica bacterium]|nr:pentapeptide repeat-containing protein [Candidatus Omnitrophota bacterium]